MKKLFFVLQLFLFIAFNFFLLLTGYQLAGSPATMQRMSYGKPAYDNKEEFDPSLQTLTTVDKAVAFCDGLYMEKANNNATIKIDETYPDIVSSVIRKRFYHGYSMYGFSNNYMAMMVSGVTQEGLGAIVVPDDILKYPYAACSQQSIVFMEILNRKGFPTRKVGFSGKKNGHFCFEVYYNNDWHFYDPDMEPNVAVLTAYHRPGISFLTKNPDILYKAYQQYPKEKVADIFMNYSYGVVNTFAAPKAIIFQKVSKFLSYSLWSFFLLAFLWARKKYKRLSRKVTGKIVRPEFIMNDSRSSAYYPA